MTLDLGESALSQVWNIIQTSKLVSATDVRANQDLIVTECVSIQKSDLLIAVINTTLCISVWPLSLLKYSFEWYMMGVRYYSS